MLMFNICVYTFMKRIHYFTSGIPSYNFIYKIRFIRIVQYIVVGFVIYSNYLKSSFDAAQVIFHNKF